MWAGTWEIVISCHLTKLIIFLETESYSLTKIGDKIVKSNSCTQGTWEIKESCHFYKHLISWDDESSSLTLVHEKSMYQIDLHGYTKNCNTLSFTKMFYFKKVNHLQ